MNATRYFNANGAMTEYWLKTVSNEYGEEFIINRYHREDGPAVTWIDGIQEWWYDGQRHRIDGPAIVGLRWRQWYLFGIQYTEEEHRIECLKLRTVEIILFED